MTIWRGAVLGACLVAFTAAAGCGRKGNPTPPKSATTAEQPQKLKEESGGGDGGGGY